MKFIKKHGLLILMFIILLIGIGLLMYPFISDYQNSKVQSTIQSEYKELEKQVDSEEKLADLKLAEEYNNKLNEQVSLKDPFIINDEKNELYTKYASILSLTGEGMMGSIEIPKINIDLPIYHGVSEGILTKGVGHLPESAFPIGQKNKHTLLAAHTGLSTAKLFTDLDKMEEGDMFFITLYDQTDAYLIDQIETVLPNDAFDLLITDPNESYITLMTCTPYGVNSHRLLVRGKKVEYSEEELEDAKEEQSEQKVQSTWVAAYLKGLRSGIFLVVVCFIFIILYQKIRV